MSRIGKQPIGLTPAVKVNIVNKDVTISGPKGELSFTLPELIDATHTETALTVVAADDARQTKAYFGLSRALLNNMVTGVTVGFKRELKIIGVGYRAQVKGKQLILNLGFSNPVEFDIPQDLTITVPSNTEIIVEGIDKQRVGQIAATIRGYRPPEPYKGKGVRYKDEHVTLKEGKKVS